EQDEAMALERLLCLVGLRPPVDGAAILEMVAVEHLLRVAGLDQAVEAPRHARVIVHHFLVDTPANQLPRRYPLPEQVQRPLRRDFARTPLVDHGHREHACDLLFRQAPCRPIRSNGILNATGMAGAYTYNRTSAVDRSENRLCDVLLSSLLLSSACSPLSLGPSPLLPASSCSALRRCKRCSPPPSATALTTSSTTRTTATRSSTRPPACSSGVGPTTGPLSPT